MKNTAFLIQARTGSTRLPDKAILPFYNRKSVLELMIEKLLNNFSLPIIIATTENFKDAKIASVAESYSCYYYRGSENDVLKRFVDTAQKFKIKNIVRICSDNPFLSIYFLKDLVNAWDDKYDYLSYTLNNGIPSILTQYGFWAELVSLNALQKANTILPSDNNHREHVTSYIYANPQTFKLKFLDIPSNIEKRTNIRLTLDTRNDFKLQQKIYTALVNKKPNFDVKEIIDFLDKNPEYYELMQNEKMKNTK